MTTSEPPRVHETHLLSRHAPFCEKCASAADLGAPCRIADDPLDVIVRSRRTAPFSEGGRDHG